MSLGVAKTQRRRMRASNYLSNLSADLIHLLQESDNYGTAIFEYILSDSDPVWQYPPIESEFVGRRFAGNMLKDLKHALKETLNAQQVVEQAWLAIASKVGQDGPVDYVSYAGYKNIESVTGLSSVDSRLIFSPPNQGLEKSVAALTLFALESAAFFAYVYDLPLIRKPSSYYTELLNGTTGVKEGKIWIAGRMLDFNVSDSALSIGLRLPRGEGCIINTRDTVDAIRTWATETQPPHIEYILDILSILRLARPGSHLVELNVALIALQPGNKSKKYVSYFDRTKIKADRQVVTLEKRELDYVKIQEILQDDSKVDVVKLLDMAEILIPNYMKYNTFVKYIGYPPSVNNVAATFDKGRYDKMVNGWSKFRDASLEKARSKVKLKFEDL